MVYYIALLQNIISEHPGVQASAFTSALTVLVVASTWLGLAGHVAKSAQKRCYQT